MSLKTSIQNLRCSLKAVQEQKNAQAGIATSRIKATGMLRIMPVAAVFVVMLAALAGTASATSIDWSVLTGLLTNVSSQVIPAIVDFIIAIVPAIVVLSIVGFVITFLDKILAIFDKVLR